MVVRKNGGKANAERKRSRGLSLTKAVRRRYYGSFSLFVAIAWQCTLLLWWMMGVVPRNCCHAHNGGSSVFGRGRVFFGKPFDSDDDDFEGQGIVRGTGREVGVNLFNGRGGSDEGTARTAPLPPHHEYLSPRATSPPRSGASRSAISNSARRRSTARSSSSSSASSSSSSSSAFSDDFATFWADRLDAFRTWLSEHNLPKIQCRVEPVSTLKLRKQFRPLKTIVTLGADFNLQLGIWRFKSSWEDSLIGGKLTLAGRELNFAKTFFVSLGGVEDLVARLKLRCAIDLATMRMYARFGCRTERISPLNIVDGFTVSKQLPLDGTNGHVKLEVRANFAFPEPEIEFSTQGLSGSSFVSGMGDIEVNIDELNLLLHY